MAVPISQRVPTLAVHAENSAELALNIVLSIRGKIDHRDPHHERQQPEQRERPQELLPAAAVALRLIGQALG